MGTLFNLDNPVWVFMGKVADLIVLNLLVIICSIPVVTIGASWTAMYFVTIRMVRKEESYIIRDFFRSFKENFKQATIIWMLVLVVGAVLIGDLLICRMLPDQIPKIVMWIVIAFTYFIVGTVIYVFPVLSRFHNTTKNTIKNAFLLSIVNIPYTLLFVVIMVAPIVCALYVIEAAPLIIALGISLPAYIASMVFAHIFRKLEPSEKEEETEEIKTEV